MVPEQLLAANFMLGTSLSHLGELAASLDHLKMALPYYTGATPILALFAGPDVGFFLLSYLSHVEWHHEVENREKITQPKQSPERASCASSFRRGHCPELCRHVARFSRREPCGARTRAGSDCIVPAP